MATPNNAELEVEEVRYRQGYPLSKRNQPVRVLLRYLEWQDTHMRDCSVADNNSKATPSQQDAEAEKRGELLPRVIEYFELY